MSRVLRSLYYKKYIFILFSIALITVVIGTLSFYLKSSENVGINLVDLVENEDGGFLDDKIKMQTEKSDNVDFNLNGLVIGINVEKNRPAVKVIINVKSEGGELVERSVLGLDYDNSFKYYKSQDIKSGQKVEVNLESPDYIFYPTVQSVIMDKANTSITFEAKTKELSSSTLELSGKINVLGKVSGVVYLVGRDAIDNQNISKFTNVSSEGKFKFTNLESGTYLVLPEVSGVTLLSKSKEVNLLNKNINVNFFGFPSTHSE